MFEEKGIQEVKKEMEEAFARIEKEGLDQEKGLGYRDGYLALLEIALSGLQVHMKGICIEDKFYGVVTMMTQEDLEGMECNCPICVAERGE